MRLNHARAVLVPFLLAGPVLAGLSSAAIADDLTRTLRLELPISAGAFTVENLAGEMHVAPGTGDRTIAVATVHAESAALADAVRFEQVRGDDGRPVLRVRYPLDEHDSLQYPREGKITGVLGHLFGRGSISDIKYDGHRVSVNRGSGPVLYADVEVTLPRETVKATFRNHVGALRGEDVGGSLTFDTGSGDVTLARVRGIILADTGSGDVKAAGVRGTLTCDTGSGDCDVSDFEGETIACNTGSGTIRVRLARARSLEADSGSGDVHATDIDVEEFGADTGSGDVRLEARGGRLARVKADTGSGNVTLRLGREAAFEARADLGSGDIISRYADAQPILHKRELVGYRRGDARIQIDVDTGSGDLILEPGT